MQPGELGRTYKEGETVFRQGDAGDCMFVIQQGRADVTVERDGTELRLHSLGPGDVFGEIALFRHAPRSATVKAAADLRVIRLDQRTFVRRVHEDPSIAYRILDKMSQRIVALSAELAALRCRSTSPAPPPTSDQPDPVA